MLLDSGADVTIILRAQWPESWPLTVASGMVTGIGGAAVTQMSTEFITFVDQDHKLLAQMWSPGWTRGDIVWCR